MGSASSEAESPFQQSHPIRFPPYMIVGFLQDLFDHGRVRVDHPDQSQDATAQQKTRELLLTYEALRCASFPGAPPQFSVDIAAWSARLFYRACQAAAFRDLEASLLDKFLGEPCPLAEDTVRTYSADLVFQFLPDLIKLTGHVSPGDPLVKILRDWANLWPLSSVGISGVEPISLRGIVDHPNLLTYYVDRVIDRQDVSRLGDPLVREGVERALSLFSPQFPELSARLLQN